MWNISFWLETPPPPLSVKVDTDVIHLINGPGLPPPLLHTVRGHKLDRGKAWERGNYNCMSVEKCNDIKSDKADSVFPNHINCNVKTNFVSVWPAIHTVHGPKVNRVGNMAPEVLLTPAQPNSYTTCARTLLQIYFRCHVFQESWSGNETTHTNNIPYLTVIPVQGHFLLLWLRPWFQWECMWHRVSSEQSGYTFPPRNSWSPPPSFPRSCSYWWESEHTLHASCTGTPEEIGENVTQLLDSH